MDQEEAVFSHRLEWRFSNTDEPSRRRTMTSCASLQDSSKEPINGLPRIHTSFSVISSARTLINELADVVRRCSPCSTTCVDSADVSGALLLTYTLATPFQGDPLLPGIPIMVPCLSKSQLSLSPSRTDHSREHGIGFSDGLTLKQLVYSNWKPEESTTVGGTWYTNAFVRGDESRVKEGIEVARQDLRAFYSQRKTSWISDEWEDGDGQEELFEAVLAELRNTDAFATVQEEGWIERWLKKWWES